MGIGLCVGCKDLLTPSPEDNFNRGVECELEGNPEEAAKYYQRAVDENYALAQYNLGVLYYNGDGVPQDYDEAARLFECAANQMLPLAQYNLGIMYLKGEGVEKDDAKGMSYIHSAAAQGEWHAIQLINKNELERQRLLLNAAYELERVGYELERLGSQLEHSY